MDICGVDIYEGARESPRFAQLAVLAKEAAQGKPIALTEVGAVPTLDILFDETEFVWFTIWGRGWLDNEHYQKPEQNGPGNSPAWIREIYANPRVITRDELPKF